MSDLPKHFLRDPGHFLAFGLGSGCAPKAPGTFGTLAALVPYLLVLQYLSAPMQLLVIVLSFVFGVWLCDRASKALGVHDHGGIVWDEFVGYWIAMIAAPVGLGWALLGFALFRLFDIWKPFPIKLLDKKVVGGFGIMVDDVLAGVYAAAGVQACAYWLI